MPAPTRSATQRQPGSFMEGVPLSEVARLLGDSEKTVERVYGKHAPDYLRRAVNALNIGI